MSAGLGQDYQARITTTRSPDAVFEALTSLTGLSAWWTTATGDPTPGGEIVFGFGPDSHAVMRVDSAERGVAVRWTTTACMLDDWVGTSQHFELEPLPGGGTAVNFRHVGLTPRLECYQDCKNGWDHFIPSLQAYLETGSGHPNGSAADTARRAERAAPAGAVAR